jgi:hypothetical protein
VAGSSYTTWGRNPDWVKITNTDEPWLQSCGLEGSMHFVIRRPLELRDAESLRVVLHFCELKDVPSPRIFDVRLQGRTVLRDLNVTEAAGGTRQALAKSFTFPNSQTIKLELLPDDWLGPPPIISGVAITAQ